MICKNQRVRQKADLIQEWSLKKINSNFDDENIRKQNLLKKAMEYYKTLPEWWHYPDQKRFSNSQNLTPKITEKSIENCHRNPQNNGPFQNQVINILHHNNDCQIKDYFRETGLAQGKEKISKKQEGQDIPIREDYQEEQLTHLKKKLQKNKKQISQQTIPIINHKKSNFHDNNKKTFIKKNEPKKQVFSKIHDLVLRDKKKYLEQKNKLKSIDNNLEFELLSKEHQKEQFMNVEQEKSQKFKKDEKMKIGDYLKNETNSKIKEKISIPVLDPENSVLQIANNFLFSDIMQKLFEEKKFQQTFSQSLSSCKNPKKKMAVKTNPEFYKKEQIQFLSFEKQPCNNTQFDTHSKNYDENDSILKEESQSQEQLSDYGNSTYENIFKQNQEDQPRFDKKSNLSSYLSYGFTRQRIERDKKHQLIKHQISNQQKNNKILFYKKKLEKYKQK